MSLGNFETDERPDIGPVVDLLFENESDTQISIDINVMVNGDGNFTGVRVGDQTISIEDWNDAQGQ